MTAFIARIVCYGALWAAMLLATFGFNTYFIEHRRPSLVGTSILIAGDSHPGTSINPDVLPGSLSITRGLEPYLMTFHKLDSLLQRPHDVQTVILGFGHHNFAPFADRVFADPSSGRTHFGAMYPLMDRRDYEPLEVNEEAYRVSLVRWLLLVPRVDHHRRYMGGFIDTPPGTYRTDAQAVAEQFYYVEGQVAAPSSVATTYLVKIMDLLEARNVHLTLVNTPVQPEYVANIPPAFTGHFEMLGAMARQRGVMVVDGSDYLPQAEGFNGPHHLSYMGSIVFTRLLMRDLGL